MKRATKRPAATRDPAAWRRVESFEIHPATPARWGDVERLFGPRGACAGCWCMWPRLPRAEFERGKGEQNRARLRALVASGEPPGVIAYAAGEPVGWCAVAPRERYVRLERSRVLARVDDAPVWSVPCFFVARAWRRQGLSVKLLEGAVDLARRYDARAVEGYPVEPRAASSAASSGRGSAGTKTAALPDAFAWTGLASAFRRAGFREVARRSPTRPILRRVP